MYEKKYVGTKQPHKDSSKYLQINELNPQSSVAHLHLLLCSEIGYCVYSEKATKFYKISTIKSPCVIWKTCDKAKTETSEIEF